MKGERQSYQERFREYIEGNIRYLLDSLEKKRKEQEEKANLGGPNEIGALDWDESMHVAAYATFYAAEDLFKSSEDVKKLSWALVFLTATLVVLTVKLILLTTR